MALWEPWWLELAGERTCAAAFGFLPYPSSLFCLIRTGVVKFHGNCGQQAIHTASRLPLVPVGAATYNL